MKYYSPALFTLPALLWTLPAAAVPSPAAYDQQLLPSAVSQPEQTRPVRWRDHLVEWIFGHKHCTERKTAQALFEQEKPSRHTFARYGGDMVLRFNVSTNDEAASLAEASDTLLLDVWEFSQDWVDIRLSKESVPLLLGLLPASLQDSHTPLLRERELAQAISDNYQRHSAQPRTTPSPQPPARRPFSPDLEQANGAETNIFFADYQPFSVIEPWLRLLASLFTTHVRLFNIGLSYEGRNIPALRVGVHPTNNDEPSPPRKTVLVVGSLHAREWISTTSVNYIAYSLITGYGKSPSITRMLESFDFVFVPILNPDGYVYTWETDRLWRKNRQQTGIRFCQGIDLDRAFGFEWSSATDNPCSESFSGDNPFEAVEAKAFAEWARNETQNNNVDFVGFLDLHSYSQQILYPYSYSCDDEPPGLENLEEVAYGLGKAIRNTHGHAYEIMPACEGNAVASSSSSSKKQHLQPRIEPSGGSALDYFYHSIGARYAYQVKLRDRGTYGFLLPKEHIIPTGREVLNAVLYFGGFLSELYGKNDVASAKVQNMEAESDDSTSGTEDRKTENDDDESWVKVEDIEPNWDLKRRRR